MPEKLVIDLDNLTIGEIETIEELTEQPFGALFGDEANPKPMGKVLRAIGYVVKRRENPDFTFDDAAHLVISIADEDAPQPNREQRRAASRRPKSGGS